MSETNVKQSSYGTAKCFYLEPIANDEYQVIVCDNNMNRVPTHKMFGCVLKSDSYYNDDTDRVCTDLAKSGIFHYRTEKEIEVLKEAWKTAPMFDIEKEWGFEHYYKELFLYRKTIEAALLKDTGKKRLHRKRLIENHWIYRYTIGWFISRFKND